MKKLTFKCTLLTDVVLNMNASTEGNQQTLDFIPGNNFLGIAASSIYPDGKITADAKLIMFHTGDVRFGDAHPAIDNKRTLKIPASMYYPKTKKVAEECYIHQGYDKEKDTEKQQLKQCRNGFYYFDDTHKTVEEAKVNKTFAIKSAYDAAERRSRDAQMYGYQSLDNGQSFIFDVEFTTKSEVYIDRIKNSLIGEKRIGRSRTAQYGLVRIELLNDAIKDYSTDKSHDCVGGYKIYAVYADSRLIFIDKNTGMPTFCPNAADLGFESGEIDWEYSQIRTFQYAPWNFKRQARDTDRCGIEKGSVFVIKKASKSPSVSRYVGEYINEGFGRVIYNPDFLNFEADHNGLSLYKFISAEKEKVEEEKDEKGKAAAEKQMIENEVCNLQRCDDLLLQYLAGEKQAEYYESLVYSQVNDFANKYQTKFSGERFASQWGTIRSIASQNKGKDAISKAVTEYISHGVAEIQWNNKQRCNVLSDFIKNTEDSYTQMAVINLAAEMEKLAKK
jgi:hypothetical protein